MGSDPEGKTLLFNGACVELPPGIPTVFDALRMGSIHSDGTSNGGKDVREVASEIMTLRDAGALAIKHYVPLRGEMRSQSLVAEMAESGPDGRVGIASLMNHTPGQRQFRDVAKRSPCEAEKRSLGDTEVDDQVAPPHASAERPWCAPRDRSGRRRARLCRGDREPSRCHGRPRRDARGPPWPCPLWCGRLTVPIWSGRSAVKHRANH